MPPPTSAANEIVCTCHSHHLVYMKSEHKRGKLLHDFVAVRADRRNGPLGLYKQAAERTHDRGRCSVLLQATHQWRELCAPKRHMSPYAHSTRHYCRVVDYHAEHASQLGEAIDRNCTHTENIVAVESAMVRSAHSSKWTSHAV